ncbi:MAG TPA: rod shape-determining protein MreD [Bacteroidales bacterium]|jgi:hypothetical protein|nr:rod shape-determining protein MreD [Bacteroidales bacterium]HPT53095.1 rod shape-determining protein MreD [Bacteroidales bacterium]
MNNPVFSNIFRFVLFLLLQIFICNHIHLFGFINPNIYLLALLLLPFDIPRPVQYLIAFATGFIVDIFQMTFGIHASAALLIMFLRPYWVAALNIGKKKVEKMEVPIPGQNDLKWLVTYTSVLVLLHQILVTMLEVFSFYRFGYTMLGILVNTAFTTLLILCIQYIFMQGKKNI